jgi:hypothetical protein
MYTAKLGCIPSLQGTLCSSQATENGQHVRKNIQSSHRVTEQYIVARAKYYLDSSLHERISGGRQCYFKNVTALHVIAHAMSSER